MRKTSFAQTEWAINQTHTVQTDFQFRVLVIIASFANHTRSWPSMPTLCRLCGNRTGRAMRRTINELVELGLLGVKAGGGRGHHNVYELNGFTPAQPEVGSLFDLDGLPEAPQKGTQTTLKEDSRVREKRTQESYEHTKEHTKTSEGAGNAPSTPPPPAASAPRESGGGQPARATGDRRVGQWIELWNAVCRQSKLAPVTTAVNKKLAVRLEAVAKHPVFNRDLDAWKRYCLWLSNHPFFGGRSAGRHGAGIAQALQAENIDAWAAATAPQGPIIKTAPEPVTPERQPAGMPAATLPPETGIAMGLRVAAELWGQSVEWVRQEVGLDDAAYSPPRPPSVDGGSDAPRAWGGDD